jgi:hypothetical protein
MNKEFIPYEQALELKELGFDEPCIAFYFYDNGVVQSPFELKWKYKPREIIYHDESGVWENFNEIETDYPQISAPLYQQAFRWFREKHNLNGILNHYPNTKLWDFSVHNLLWNGKEFMEHVKKEDRSVKYSTYEEAELACLKKLIELIKTK